MSKPYEKLRTQMTDKSRSALQLYQHMMVGSESLIFTIKYEIILGLLDNFPGALGLFLRQKFYKFLFKSVGKGVVFGRTITIRHPRKIELGQGVVIADGCVLDARGDTDNGIVVGENTIIGQGVRLICKSGNIRLGNQVDIGAYSSIHAIAGNVIDIGDHVLIAPYSYIGCTRYKFDRIDIPISMQGIEPRGGIKVGNNTWLGAKVALLDGISVGNDVIIAAGAVVTKDIEPYAISMGVPAKKVRRRTTQTDLDKDAQARETAIPAE